MPKLTISQQLDRAEALLDRINADVAAGRKVEARKRVNDLRRRIDKIKAEAGNA